MTVLVTGATGYLGGRLARALAADGVAVHAVVRPGAAGQALAAAGIAVHADPGDGSALAGILAAVRPATVYHLATCYRWDHRPEEVPALLDANLRFAGCLAEAALAAGAGVVSAGTGFQHAGPRGRPVSLYAVTKQAFEDLLAWYGWARGLRCATVLLNDTYGPRDPRGKLFGLLRAAAADGRTLAMSPGGQVVDLAWADDAAAAFRAAAAALAPGHRRWLASGGEPLPLRAAVERWSAATGLRPRIEWGARPYREREVMAPWLAGDPPPGWRPAVALDEGFRRMERDP